MTVSVDAVIYARIFDATMSIINVENAHASTKLLAATTLRNVLGTKVLSEILSDRESIAQTMQVKKYFGRSLKQSDTKLFIKIIDIDS